MELIKNTTGKENVGKIERWASLLGGGALMAHALKRRSFISFPIAVLAGSFIYRGVTGYCGAYEALGIDTSGRAADVDRSFSPGGEHTNEPRKTYPVPSNGGTMRNTSRNSSLERDARAWTSSEQNIE